MAQQRQTYHHKDLRNALIETGIQLVSTEGVNRRQFKSKLCVKANYPLTLF